MFSFGLRSNRELADVSGGENRVKGGGDDSIGGGDEEDDDDDAGNVAIVVVALEFVAGF